MASPINRIDAPTLKGAGLQTSVPLAKESLRERLSGRSPGSTLKFPSPTR